MQLEYFSEESFEFKKSWFKYLWTPTHFASCHGKNYVRDALIVI